MKDSDKITLTVGQIKRLIKESVMDDGIIKVIVDDALERFDYELRHNNSELENFRYKLWNTNQINENTIEVFWLTQDSFRSDEFDRFADLMQKQIEFSADNYDYRDEIIVKLIVQCRDGKFAGYGKKILNISY